MKPNYIKLLVLLLFFASCTKDDTVTNQDETTDVDTIQKEILKISEINSKINEFLSQTNDFNWKDVDDHMLWSAVVHGNNILTIGYGQENENFNEHHSRRLTNTKDDILEMIAKTEDFKLSKGQNKNVVEYKIINAIDVKVENLETVIALRKAKNIRYLEPNGYNKYIAKNSLQRSTAQTKFQTSGSGCSKESESINSDHYQTISPNNAQVAWNFYKHNIPQAWNISTGAGITIGLIDTGVSANQSLLNTSGFNDGVSNGRRVEKKGTFNYDGPDDKCGHGTQMASTMAAPRNNDGMPVGVAYNCNLVAYRATEDVLLNDYEERKGVSQALIELGNRSDVKIISMSIGWTWSIGNIKDAIKYANSKGKLIFAAGGTSTNFTNWYGVTFPATMDETVAVTGVDDGANYERCNICHSGSKIDFTIVMEGDNNTSKHPPVVGFNNGTRIYTGGSSVATATTAGIAALIWAKHPDWNKDQVLNKLKQSAALYPNKNSQFGYGNIDALKAVQ
ncbi:serine protease [Flavivirga aquatica]|uniref:Serine protease n=1 Tax=Flavivirga aquatica TaxID=1849968 RepID=A0A1E5T8H4_9FLAO|nr:S8 family serine peptidase [Flavivirga aquatica]OEK07670.1 serine protease [Flavivirga aquatica]